MEVGLIKLAVGLSYTLALFSVLGENYGKISIGAARIIVWSSIAVMIPSLYLLFAKVSDIEYGGPLGGVIVVYASLAVLVLPFCLRKKVEAVGR